MSWFGGSKKADPAPEAKGAAPGSQAPAVARPAAPAARRPRGHDGQKASVATDVTGFDPTALERGVVAIDRLDNSPHSDRVLDLLFDQERTKQLEYQAKMREHEVLAARARAEQERQRAQNLDKEGRWKQENQQKQAQLQRQLAQEKEKAREEQNQRWLQKQQQQFLQQEEMKRKNAEKMAKWEAKMREQTEAKIMERRMALAKQEEELKQQTARVREKAKAEGQALRERQNKDIDLEKLKLGKLEDRKTLMVGMQMASQTIGKAYNSFMNDPSQALKWLGIFTGMCVSVYGVREGAKVAAALAKARLGKPPLVRETSRMNPFRKAARAMTAPFRALGSSSTTDTTALAWRAVGASSAQVDQSDLDAMVRADPKVVTQHIVLEEQLSERLAELCQSARITKDVGGVFQNVLLHGPPGTGKSLFARTMARFSGLDYAIMAGADVAPLGEDAVDEMNKIFDWAEQSDKGMVFFIDEAEAFLRKRGAGGLDMSENLRNVLSTFLTRTGTESRQYMIVLATNEPGLLDNAVLDRMDEPLQFPLPGSKERLQLLDRFAQKHLFGPDAGTRSGQTNQSWWSSMTASDILPLENAITTQGMAKIAAATDGWSGRQLEKFMIAVQGKVNSSGALSVDDALLQEVLEWRVSQKDLLEEDYLA